MILQRIVSGVVWIACGILVLTLRNAIFQGVTILAWEIIGAGMIAYGALNFIRAFVRNAPAKSRVA